MNKLILCEGKADAILISYYLERACGWSHRNNRPANSLVIKTDETKNEYGYWYRKEDDQLFICGVGERNNFGKFFRDRILDIMIDEPSAFTKIAVISDSDNREIISIEDSFKTALGPVIVNVENNKWTNNIYTNSFGLAASVDFLLTIIPSDKEGAMETLLLDAISDDPDAEVVVEKSKEFIRKIEPDALKYINKARLKLKACLGVVWSIQYPGKIFSFIDEQIRSVKWEDSKILNECFGELRNI